MLKPWTLTPEQAIQEYKTNADSGLSSSAAQALIREHGPNKLDDSDTINYGLILLHQIFNAMIIVLFASMIIALAIRDWISGGVIGAVVLINVAIGFWQEVKAEKTMQELRIMSSPSALVTRDGDKKTINAEEVALGDLVHLNVGDMIPADVRLISVVNFATDEALLTGETIPITKSSSDIFDENTGVGDRLNMAYSSSIVTSGRASGVAVATGMQTEIGQIAASLRGANSQQKSWYVYIKDWVGYFLGVNIGTPLQRKLSWLAIILFGIAVVFCLVVMGSQRMDVTREVAIYAICVAISMIPSALVVVLSITMAVGSKVMATKHVIVRKLDSLEALGGIDAICSDKTGTLTQGKMVSKMVWIRNDGTYTLNSGVLSTTQLSPQLINNSKRSVQFTPIKEHSTPFRKWLLTATLANTATVLKNEDGEWGGQGDPTEMAIQVLCAEANHARADVIKSEKLEFVKEYPFDSSVKRMSTIYRFFDGTEKVFSKGAVERLLDLCILDTVEKEEIEANVTAMSSKGLRVLAFATKEAPSTLENREDVESKLEFQGLIGIYDPPRPETAGSVAKCHNAGISVHMLTGDHISTATAIAQEVGIIPTNYTPDMVMSATQFDAISDEDIDALTTLPLVVARCSPQSKVRMIQALHRRNKYCAMTGDGVNDSPSLKMADVGIAMGLNGSDVAKNISDIVLSDDNFASILNAIEEGRRMAANIQKFVLQLLAENIAQAIYLLVGLAFFDDSGFSVFPLSPIEVLWILVVTSLFPAMGLGLEKASKDILEKPPNRRVFTKSVLIDMAVYGVWMAGCCMATFSVVVFGHGNGNLGSNCNTDDGTNCELVFEARAATFATMTWCALFLAWECVDPMLSIIHLPIWHNKLLLWSIIGGFVSVFPIVYIPVINDDVFLHRGITWEWGPAIGFSLVYLLGSEIWKAGKRFNNWLSRREPKQDCENQAPLSRFSTFTSWTTGSTAFENSDKKI